MKQRKETISQHTDNMFWNKVDQALNCLEALHKEGVKVGKNNSVLAMNDELVLFAMIVFDKEYTRGRMAFFTAEPKEKDDYQVALMWRSEFHSDRMLEKLDLAYSIFINAAMKLQLVCSDPKQHSCKWQYLGPNCTKVIHNGVSS